MRRSNTKLANTKNQNFLSFAKILNHVFGIYGSEQRRKDEEKRFLEDFGYFFREYFSGI